MFRKQRRARGRDGDPFPPSRSLSSPLPAPPGRGAATHVCGSGGERGLCGRQGGVRGRGRGQETAADVGWPHPGTERRVLAAVTCAGQGLCPGPAGGAATFPGLSLPHTGRSGLRGSVRAGTTVPRTPGRAEGWTQSGGSERPTGWIRLRPNCIWRKLLDRKSFIKPRIKKACFIAFPERRD